jgi:flagellar protein FliS
MTNRYQALNSYRQVGAHTQVAAAEDPYRLVQLLIDGSLERLAAARGNLQRGEVGAKAEQLSRVVAIVESLNGSLDMGRGGEVAANLRQVYDYATKRLTEANLANDLAGIDEVAGLLREIKAGWDGIAAQARAAGAAR